ncbi:serine/threonine-protein kinase [Planctomycetota bacterium]
MENKQTCPECGQAIENTDLIGLCPACMMKVGIGSIEGDGTRASRFDAPPPEDLADLFPQLEIQEQIGAGGMGAVYKARQKDLDRTVALKILAPRGKDDASFAPRFTREAQALARLSHPHIVAVHDFGQAGELYYFIMEFVDGTNLRQIQQAGILSPKEALAIIPQICTALQYAHDQGVVHRDIKPENILLDKQGNVKIADFGLAKVLGQEPVNVTLTQEGHVMGTPHYMAPEQVEHPKDVDHRADIYSLGVVFYEMLTGELPLGKFQPPSQKVQIDVRLDEVVLKTLAKEPQRRYQQVSQVGTEVESIVANASRVEAGSLKRSMCFVSTPEYLRTFKGRFRNVHQGKGELELNSESLCFISGWQTVVMPLCSIQSLALGEYPSSAKPVPYNYLEVRYTDHQVVRTLLFTPGHSRVKSMREANNIVKDWLIALQEAIQAHSGVRLSVGHSEVAKDGFWIGYLKAFLLTAISCTVIFALKPLLFERRLPSLWDDLIFGPMVAVITMGGLLLMRWWHIRSGSLLVPESENASTMQSALSSSSGNARSAWKKNAETVPLPRNQRELDASEKQAAQERLREPARWLQVAGILYLIPSFVVCLSLIRSGSALAVVIAMQVWMMPSFVIVGSLRMQHLAAFRLGVMSCVVAILFPCGVWLAARYVFVNQLQIAVIPGFLVGVIAVFKTMRVLRQPEVRAAFPRPRVTAHEHRSQRMFLIPIAVLILIFGVNNLIKHVSRTIPVVKTLGPMTLFEIHQTEGVVAWDLDDSGGGTNQPSNWSSMSDERRLQWATSTGVDLMLDDIGEPWNLLTPADQGAVLILVDNSLWDKPSIRGLTRAFSNPQDRLIVERYGRWKRYALTQNRSRGVGLSGPKTLAIRTSKGAMGLLRITSSILWPQAITFSCKFLKIEGELRGLWATQTEAIKVFDPVAERDALPDKVLGLLTDMEKAWHQADWDTYHQKKDEILMLEARLLVVVADTDDELFWYAVMDHVRGLRRISQQGGTQQEEESLIEPLQEILIRKAKQPVQWGRFRRPPMTEQNDSGFTPTRTLFLYTPQSFRFGVDLEVGQVVIVGSVPPLMTCGNTVI